MPDEYERLVDGYIVTTDRRKIDVDRVETFLRESYWAHSRPRERIERSMDRSLCFGMLDGDELVAFARVVTDYTDFAWLCDVFVDEERRGRNVGRRLITAVLGHPDLQGLRRWILATRDAHGIYKKFGFTALKDPARWMERS